MRKKARVVAALLPKGQRTVTLEAPDLQEFRLRRATLDTARFNFLMIEEAYNRWCKDICNKYGLSGKYDIDVQTGAITPRHNG